MHLNIHNSNLTKSLKKCNILHTGKLCKASGTTIMNRSLALSNVGVDMSSLFCSTDDRRLI